MDAEIKSANIFSQINTIIESRGKNSTVLDLKISNIAKDTIISTVDASTTAVKMKAVNITYSKLNNFMIGIGLLFKSVFRDTDFKIEYINAVTGLNILTTQQRKDIQSMF